MKKLFVVFLIVLTQLSARQRCESLFILQDAGETQALLPVIEECEKKRESFLILTGGVATEIVAKKPSLKKKTISFSQLGIQESVDKSWKREERLSYCSLAKIAACLQTARVITGVAFELQGQLLATYQQENTPTYAYWDNINPDGEDPYFSTAKKVAQIADHLMVPSTTFLEAYPHATVVGQPAMEAWKEELKQIDTTAVRSKIPFPTTDKTIVFIGGYGKEYDEAIELFLSGADQLLGYTIFIAPHPKTGGVVENEKLQNQTLPHVHVIDPSWGISSMEAAALADHLICHQSTMGIQASLAGKDVTYFVPPTQSYTNPLIEKGLVTKASTVDQQKQALEVVRSIENADLFQILQLPYNGKELLYLCIFSHLIDRNER